MNEKAIKPVVIDDGTRKIPIENQYGQLICNIYMRPADFSLLDRYQAIMEDFQNIVKPLEALSITNDGKAEVDADYAILKSVEQELYKRINALFDIEEAEQIFAKRSPFSSVGGKFFVEIVFEAIGGLIKDAMSEELELSSKRMGKYLDDDRPATEDAAG